MVTAHKLKCIEMTNSLRTDKLDLLNFIVILCGYYEVSHVSQ